MRQFPASGEINRRVADAVILNMKNSYQANTLAVDHTDGLSMELSDWRFNLRSSKTEPVLRLNVESRGDEGLMRVKTAELPKLIDNGALAKGADAKI